MSSIAVFLVLGGATALAAGLAKNSVGSKQLKKNAVTSAKIKKNAVTSAKIKNGAITGAKVNLVTFGTVPNATHADSAGSAGSAGNADTVDGQHVVKFFKTLTAGQSGVGVGSAGGFSFTATCESSNADVNVSSPSGVGWVMHRVVPPETLKIPSRNTTVGRQRNRTISTSTNSMALGMPPMA